MKAGNTRFRPFSPLVIAAAVTLVFATSKTEPETAQGCGTGASDEEPNGKTIAEITRQIREVQKKKPTSSTSGCADTRSRGNVRIPYPPLFGFLSEKTGYGPVRTAKLCLAIWNGRHPIKNEYIFQKIISKLMRTRAPLLFAALGGTVYNTGFDDEQGNYIVIDHGGSLRRFTGTSGRRCQSGGHRTPAIRSVRSVRPQCGGPCMALAVRVNISSVNPLEFYEDYSA